MAIVEVHPEPIDGPWIEGFVLDRHVISSHPIGYVGEHMQSETTRSALGELVYQLKYRNGPLNDIVETAIAFINVRSNPLTISKLFWRKAIQTAWSESSASCI